MAKSKKAASAAPGIASTVLDLAKKTKMGSKMAKMAGFPMVSQALDAFGFGRKRLPCCRRRNCISRKSRRRGGRGLWNQGKK